jgi:hypothetical protein
MTQPELEKQIRQLAEAEFNAWPKLARRGTWHGSYRGIA